MSTKKELSRETGRLAAERLKITARLRACLLISFAAIVLCAAGIGYVFTLEPSGGVETKRTILMIITFALCAYSVVSFTKGYLDARTQLRHIAEMTARLTEQESPAPGREAKASQACETDALIRKIVQAINA